jgi:hypothetical protein
MAVHRLVALVFAFLIFTPFTVSAQNQPPPAAAPASGDQLLSAGEVDALVAPIALYPDNLLSLVLMASTYPLEVVQADRWASSNKNLKGDELKAAVDKQGWDDSVKSLVATPDVLSMMSTKLDWTQKLGDAVLAQQQDVMDAIQRLRAKADANNKLTTTKQQKVTKSSQAGKQYIAIEPTDPETLYVPYYDPGVVYGAWPYPSYPPYYFGYPGYIAGGLIAGGLAFGAGYALGRWQGGNYWGGNVNWNNNNINIKGGNNWQHNVNHRQGVRYNNSNVANRFGGNANRGNVSNRMDFRGQGQAGLGDRGGNRPGGGDRPGAGNRPGAGDRPGAGNRPGGGGNRPGAGNRPGGGGAAQRPGAGNRPGGGGQRPAARPGGGGRGGNALAGAGGGGRGANMASARGRASMGGGGRGGGGGGARMGGGGGGRGGGGGGRGGGGGGRRSDIALKHDIVLLGNLDNGLGFYRFSYNGSDKAYVGVMAQEVQTVMPDAVTRGQDGYLRVFYGKLGVKFQTYEQWIASGAHVPATISASH